MSLSATSHDFGNVAVGQSSSPYGVTLTNNGTADLHVGTLTTSGDFAVSGSTCDSAVAPGHTCTFNVTFTPTTSGVKSGSITIPDNAPGNPHSLSLSGTSAASYSSGLALTDPASKIDGHFGSAVATSAGTLVVGEPGVKYEAPVYIQYNAGWLKQADLSAGDSSTVGDFGVSVAISGNTAVVGDDQNNGGIGAAYVFFRNSSSTWGEQGKLVYPGAGTGSNYGSAVAVSGNTVAVGASGVGVYVYTRSGSDWTLQQTIARSGGSFGNAVALDGDTLVVGDSNAAPAGAGAIYVYTRSGSTWSLQQSLTASGASSLGSAVAVCGDTLVSGAPWTDSLAGKAYVFTRSGSTWSQQAELAEAAPSAGEAFGASVSIDGNAVAVGAPATLSGGAGSVTLFNRSGVTWSPDSILADPVGTAQDGFGLVSLSNRMVVVGAPGTDASAKSNSGAAYLYFPDLSMVDLRVVVNDDDSTPDEGQHMKFWVSVTNLGPSPATSVVVNVHLPAGVHYVASSVTQGSYDPATSVWTIGTARYQPAPTMTLDFDVTVDKGAGGQALTASADLVGTDLNAANNSSSVTATVNANPPAAGQTIMVNTNADTVADDGLCSLREAFNAANTDTASDAQLGECVAGSGPDSIAFLSAYTFTPTSPLPALTSPANIITGRCGQGIYPGVTLDGRNAGSSADGIVLSGGSSTLYGLRIRNFAGGSGVRVNSSGNTISCSIIGSENDNGVATPNLVGVKIVGGANNLIGRADGQYAPNSISGNTTVGVWVTGAGATGNQIAGNAIGYYTPSWLSNAVGVRIDGGASGNTIGSASAPFGPNFIASNTTDGIELFADNNVVHTNYIGVTMAGYSAGNGLTGGGGGITIMGNNNTIGGAAATDFNLISANLGGVGILSGSGNLVQGNVIGLSPGGNAAMGNQVGITALPHGSGSPNRIIDNVIGGNTKFGVWVGAISGGPVPPNPPNADNTVLSGNKIGTDATGMTAIPNGTDELVDGGVVLNGVSGTQLTGNLIAYNSTTADDFGIQTNNAAPAGSINNCVYGNSKGLVNTTTTGLTFENNWWGAAPSPSLGTDLSGAGQANVDYSPFLSAPPAACAPDVSLSDTFHDFGSQLLNTPSAPFSVTVTNVGSFPLHVGTLTASGDFAVSGSTCGSVVAPGGTCTFVVTFTPTAVGADSGSVTIPDDTPVRQHSVSLAGTGTQASASATIEVNTANDTTNATDGRCSLREAITAANTDTASGSVSGECAAGDSTNTDTIAFTIGSGVQTIQPLSELPAIAGTVVIDGSTQPGFAGTPIIELDGALAGTGVTGLTINAPGGSTIRGLVINRFDANGIQLLSSNNTVVGSYIGTGINGTTAPGNGQDGIYLHIANTNTISGNLISGNGTHIVDPNQNQGCGIYMDTGTGNVIQGNRIGTDAGGNSALGNAHGGIGFTYGTNTIIGGGNAGEGNVISGNTIGGIFAVYDAGTVIKGNKIGTNANGTAGLGNGGFGVMLWFGTNNAIVGGTTPGDRNIISANTGYGIVVGGVSQVPSGINIIAGNYIGANASGAPSLGNTSDGIQLVGTQVGTIGGTSAGSGNLIVGNGGAGISAPDSLSYGTNTPHVAFLGNSIYGNTGLGINLSPDGVSANDTGDADSGPNLMQNYPVLTSALLGGDGSVTIGGTLNSAASRQFRLEFFANPSCDASGYGEGQTYLGSTTVTTDSSGNASFSMTASGAPQGQSITATATDQIDGVTSEFSACRVVVSLAEEQLSPATKDFGGQLVGSTSATQPFTLTNTGGATLHITTLTKTGSAAFILGSGTCTDGATVSPNATCTFTVKFSPTAVGAVTGGVSITSDAASSPHGVSLTGTGIQPTMSLSATSHSFGSGMVGQPSSPYSVTLTNTGTADLHVETLTASGDFAVSGSTCGSAVAPSGTCTFNVTFTPTATGTRTGSVTIPDDAPGSPHSITLTGNGLPAGQPVPPAPTIISPADHTALTATPTFSWKPLAGAGVSSSYELQVASASTFDVSPVNTIVCDTTQANTSRGGCTFTQDGAYFWRVHGFNANNDAGLWSSPAAFTLNRKPLAVTLLGPGKTSSDNTPTIRWTPGSTGENAATHYTLTIKQGKTVLNSPNPMVIDASACAPTCTVDPHPALAVWPMADGAYSLAVTPVNDFGTGPTLSGGFTIDTAVPAVPYNIAPRNLSIVTTSRPRLSVGKIRGVTGYDFELTIPSDTDFASPLYTGSSPNGLAEVNTLSPTAYGDYIWHARAFDAAGNRSGWSYPFTFTYTGMLSPLEGGSTGSVPTFKWAGVKGAAGWTLAYGQDPDPAKNSLPIDLPGRSASYRPRTPLADGVYYWALKGDNGTWMPAQRFVVTHMTSPDDNAASSPTVKFGWATYKGAPGWDLSFFTVTDLLSCASADPDLGSIQNFPSGATRAAVASGLADGFYCWSLRSTDGTPSPWMPNRAFTVTHMTLPPDGAMTTDATPTFKWLGVKGASSWDLYYGTGLDLVATGTHISGLSSTASSYTVPALTPLDRVQKYYWTLVLNGGTPMPVWSFVVQ